MQKTPSVFLRNPENMSELTTEVNPLAQWVIDGEGTATRKYDGTCVAFLNLSVGEFSTGLDWWVRREVKEHQTAPKGFFPLAEDPTTGKTMGWIPAETSDRWVHMKEAIELLMDGSIGTPPTGTYELCGPKASPSTSLFSTPRLRSSGLPARSRSRVLMFTGASWI